MERKARLLDIAKDYKTGQTRLTFSAPVSPEDAEAYLDKDLRLNVGVWREKRSLDANAYYWVLLGKLAGKLGVSTAYLHNEMLSRYGQPTIAAGQLVYAMLPDTEATEKMVRERTDLHLSMTSNVKPGKEGKPDYRAWLLMRGSSDYDTDEMRVLIDGLVWDCKEQGIEVIPRDELDRMMELYEKHHSGGYN